MAKINALEARAAAKPDISKNGDGKLSTEVQALLQLAKEQHPEVFAAELPNDKPTPTKTETSSPQSMTLEDRIATMTELKQPISLDIAQPWIQYLVAQPTLRDHILFQAEITTDLAQASASNRTIIVNYWLKQLLTIDQVAQHLRDEGRFNDLLIMQGRLGLTDIANPPTPSPETTSAQTSTSELVNTSSVEPNPTPIPTTNPETQTPEPKKKGFWKKIFG